MSERSTRTEQTQAPGPAGSDERPLSPVHYIERFSLLSETFLYLQPVAQKRVGAEPVVLAEGRCNERDRPFDRVSVVERPSRISVPAFLGRIARLSGGPPLLNRGTARFSAALERLGGDVLHAHYGWSGVFLLEAARRAGIPLVVSFYGNDATRPPGRGVPLGYGALFRGAARVLALSTTMARRLADLGCPEDKLLVHHLGVDTAQIAFRAPEVWDPGQRPLRIVSVGRLVEKKGMDVLLGAAALLDDRPLLVEIIGEGPQRPHLEEMARRCPDHVEIRFRGALRHADTLRRMGEGDLFVLASRIASDGDAEGTPTVLLEAQALGLPVVSTRHEGIPECLPPEHHGWLAPEDDPGALAERIRKLADAAGSWPEIARTGRRHVETEFDATKLAGDAILLYREVLEGGSS